MKAVPGESAEAGGVEEAARAMDLGGIVAFPTETVCGLGCRLDRPDAIRRLFELKGRPSDKPLQVLLSDPSLVPGVAEVPAHAALLLDRFTPGPLTLVLTSRIDVPELGAGGTIGVRIPDHPVALQLLRQSGPAAASSANLSGRPTPGSIPAVRELFGDSVDAYADGPPAPGGLDSTILDLTRDVPRVLRRGALAVADLEEALGIGVGGGGC
ncbi:MAG TPA: L-threonylcarbamoyladenylate synthase [Actinomycetota bacterium]|nr:L-threonylcarbamoyladenylate synthase [Actinomycetota bacterium]